MKKTASVAPKVLFAIFCAVLPLVFFGSVLMMFLASPFGLIFAGLALLWIAKVL